MEFNDDLTSVVRHHNKVLRRVNKVLRSSNKTTQEYNDTLFRELCNNSSEAELAMEKLWALGKLNCDPKDYDTIVELIVAQLSQTQQAISNEDVNY